jgi:dolichol-phosphate mannosyltransferase
VQENIPELRYINNTMPGGFGYALRFGLDRFLGDCIAIVMADGSDSPEDLVVFYRTMVEGNYDAVFGSRFMSESKVVDYPKLKLIVNRLANKFISILFRLKYNDVTNAFKLYRRETIHGLKPFLAPHFNLTVELPLKTIVRNYSYTWVPNSWFNRVKGESKLKIKEMGSRYLFIVLYCLIEKYLTRGDYHKK